MERRKALLAALSGTIAATNGTIGLAAVTDVGFLGFGGGSHAVTSQAAAAVQTVKDVYDTVVVTVPSDPQTAAPISPPLATAPAAVDPTTTTTTVAPPPPDPTPVTTPPLPSPTTTTTTTPPTTSPAATATRTFSTAGGDVTARCDGNAISIVSIAPASGYAAKVENSGPQAIEVQLLSRTREYEVHAQCVAGQPERT